MKAKKRKSRIRIAIVIILIPIVFFLYTDRSNLSNRFKARGLLFSIEKEYGKYINLEVVEISEVNKTFYCKYELKDYGWGSNKYRMDTLNNIRNLTEQYLQENKDYFLNGYKISIVFAYSHLGKNVVFRNYYDTLSQEEIYLDKLLYAQVSIPCKLSDLINYSDIIYLRLNSIVIDDLSSLESFEGLKYIYCSGGFNEEQIKIIHEILPNCIIE